MKKILTLLSLLVVGFTAATAANQATWHINKPEAISQVQGLDSYNSSKGYFSGVFANNSQTWENPSVVNGSDYTNMIFYTNEGYTIKNITVDSESGSVLSTSSGPWGGTQVTMSNVASGVNYYINVETQAVTPKEPLTYTFITPGITEDILSFSTSDYSIELSTSFSVDGSGAKYSVTGMEDNLSSNYSKLYINLDSSSGYKFSSIDPETGMNITDNQVDFQFYNAPTTTTFTVNLVEASAGGGSEDNYIYVQIMDVVPSNGITYNTGVDYGTMDNTDPYNIQIVPSEFNGLTEIDFYFNGSQPFKVTLDDQEIEKDGDNLYDQSGWHLHFFMPSDYFPDDIYPEPGQTIKIWMEDPNPAMTHVSFSVTNSENPTLKNFFNALMVNYQRYEDPYLDGVDILQGKNLEVYFNSTDFDVHKISVKKDGVEEVLWAEPTEVENQPEEDQDEDEVVGTVEIPKSWYGNLEWETLEFIADVELTKVKAVTFKAEVPEGVVVTDKTYLVDYTLSEKEEIIEFLTSTENIIISGADGYRVTEIKVNDEPVRIRDLIEISNGMTIEVSVEEYIRDKSFTVFLNEDDIWDSVELSLGYGTDWQKDYKLEPGYTEIKYNVDDLPISIVPRPNSGGIKATIYRNDLSNIGKGVFNDEFNGYKVEDLESGDMVYIYENKVSQLHTVTYSIADDVNVSVTHHVSEVIEKPAEHQLMPGSHISISLVNSVKSRAYSRDAIDRVAVFVNDAEIDAEEDGMFQIKVTGDLTIDVRSIKNVPVTFEFADDMEGSVTSVVVAEENVTDWSNGFYADEKDPLVVTFNISDYDIKSVTVDGEPVSLSENNGVGTLTTTVGDGGTVIAVDGTTGISGITIFEQVDGEIYNLQGHKVNAKNLTKGIYIINGKKLLVK